MWSNLRGLGYGHDLNTLDYNKKGTAIIGTDYHKLPRYMLSNNEKNFEFLMALLNLGDEVAMAVWHLIFRLAPSELQLAKVLNLFKEKPKFEELFNEKQPYESTINLFLAETLIVDMAPPEIMEIRKESNDENRVMWKINFIRNSGLEWIIKVSIKKLIFFFRI